jgi:hypothetical protein
LHSAWPGSRRARLSLFFFALAIAFGVFAIARALLDDNQSPPPVTDNELLDLLGWIPSTDQSLRAWAVWSSTEKGPVGLTDVGADLAISPMPLALGLSADWQRETGISASEVTGWATSPGANVSVLEVHVNRHDLEQRLQTNGYLKSSSNGISIWTDPSPATTGSTINGDDPRSLNAIAIAENRVVIGITNEAVVAAIDAAYNQAPSIADDQAAKAALGTGDNVGAVAIDLRDMAVSCGVSNGWRLDNFAAASGRSVIVTYGFFEDGTPRTSVWTQYADNGQATLGLTMLDTDWRNGFVNQMGIGESVSTFASVVSVTQVGPFVVADLANGRENGWVRSGIRYLVSICEQAANLMPAGTPIPATPADGTTMTGTP